MYATATDETVETDILVIGAGPGGMAATAAAVEHGAHVVVLEAADRIGGNAIWSTGYVAFVDSDLQRRHGVEDSVEQFMADANAVIDEMRPDTGVIWDPQLGELFARESAETYRILVERGVNFPRFIPRPLQHTITRLAAVEDTHQFARAFTPEFEGPHVTAYLNTRAERLVTEGGRVVGVHVPASAVGPAFTVRARRGVVLATGGVQANPEIRRRLQPEGRAVLPYLGIDTSRGDGHLMGAAVGGDWINTTLIPPLIIVASVLLEDAIAVNRHGERFHNETGVYDHRVAALWAQPDEMAYYVFDAQTHARKTTYVRQLPDEVFQADTLAELGDQLGLPSRSLEASVRQWNEFLDTDLDTDPATGRVSLPVDRRGILEPPFFASRMVAGASISATGFTTTRSMQVVDVWGAPIPGLFAVGDTAGGFVPCHHLGGIHIGGALTLGRVAGRAVATGELTAPHTVAPAGHFLPSRLGSRIEIVHVDPSSDPILDTQGASSGRRSRVASRRPHSA
jgi:succinate dehydrogenase/fumarate reductase flavoprotein subunit